MQLTIEAEIARHICEEIREEARRNKAVRLPLKIAEYQQLWPAATRDQILRGILIAYETLVLDVAEAISVASGKPPIVLPVLKDRRGDDGAES